MRDILLIFSILFFTPQVLTAIPANTSDGDKWIEVKNISYNYEMFVYENGRANCNGPLTLDITFSKNCNRILLFKSRAHLLSDDRILSWALSEFSIPISTSDIEISLANISWGTYFKLRADFEDGTFLYTPTYCTNSYINENDLNIVIGQASVDHTIYDSLNISVNNNFLSIDTSESVDFTIADLNGNIYFSGIISRPTLIPIDNVTSPIILVRYKIKDSIITKKFIVK